MREDDGKRELAKTATGIVPLYSRSRVDRAGDAIRKGSSSVEDRLVLENWRGAHAHVINTFQATLRRRAKGTSAVVGQRLKRRPTIVDKLTRQPQMQLSRMHDIAGCRVIFDTVEQMLDFREEFNSSRAKHDRLTAHRDQFNYLHRPKPTGYRGIHDVYKYEAYQPSAAAWNGLRIEVQFRTRVQHAWATAVEIADLLTRSRGKFNQASQEYHDFFVACSEILARTKENSVSSWCGREDTDLLREFRRLNAATSLLRILRRSNERIPQIPSRIVGGGLNTILVYPFEDDGKLQGFGFRNMRVAIKRYEELERRYDGQADIVLVRAGDLKALKRVFQNYFTDATDFVRYVDAGVKKLQVQNVARSGRKIGSKAN
ncbi:RelA/SpoT domain-containing protein [Parvularcula sp. ZS-1/3]|uniref:RelA/SpoT domain-containing protein n=1 Tax=Parvularcula mediterranea TaxID=2732508 RepID=A0A7Y3W699_9PROT|nr:RelA/SpoT domain-containing protein [Parvularcula mediterranea]NNU17303.1 RelA/SpoT domain-containing protein [Parvularcula mediterranea]